MYVAGSFVNYNAKLYKVSRKEGMIKCDSKTDQN